MISINTIKKLRFRYIIGLSSIALLVTASYFTMHHVVSKQRNIATVINLAGHQAGLCNRIAYFASIMATTDDETEFNTAKSEVGFTMHQIKKAYTILKNGDPNKGIPRLSNDKIETIYTDPMVGLDTALNNFLERAEEAYAMEMDKLSIQSTSYIYLTTYGPHVLDPLLDAAVEEYENIGKVAIVKIERLELMIWIATILTLLLEIILIFFPMERSVRKALGSLESTIEELTRTRQRLVNAQKLALIGDIEVDMTTKKVTCSNVVYELFGLNEQKSLDLDIFLTLIHPEDKARVQTSYEKMLTSKKPTSVEYRIIKPNGDERLVFRYAQPVKGKNGEIQLISGAIQDITERKELSVRLEKLTENIPGFIFQILRDPEGQLHMQYVSRGILETHGVDRDKAPGDGSLVFSMIHEEDRGRVQDTMRESRLKGTTWQVQYRILHPKKGQVWLEGQASPERLIDGSVLWHGYIRDITERKLSEERIRKLALYDPLTGLANRRLLKDRLKHAIATSQRNMEYGAVIMLDLDNFKILNDTKGHDVGDELLIEAAKRLTNAVRNTDTVSRLGGDEFVILLELLGKDKEIAQNKAMELAEHIRESLSIPYYLGQSAAPHHSYGSIGVALFQGVRKNESELLKRADIAMYEAKDSGRNRVCLYNCKRQEAVMQQSAILHDLQLALDRDQFELFLQPQFARTGSLCGAEALIRWKQQGKSEYTLPDAFIPIAESSNIIIRLGEWVLEKACSQLIKLNSLTLPESFTLSVNISARQLDEDNFSETIRSILQKSGINPRQLKLELTETSLAKSMERGRMLLSGLQETGIQIELDDFGTGYSSLKSLSTLPINTLKLDLSLVQGIENEPSTKPIIRAILAMAQAMQLKVIAEGVETPEQNQYLINEGCDVLQGYLYAQAMDFDSFVYYIQENESYPSPDTLRQLSKHFPPLPDKRAKESIH